MLMAYLIRQYFDGHNLDAKVFPLITTSVQNKGRPNFSYSHIILIHYSIEYFDIFKVLYLFQKTLKKHVIPPK